MPSENAKAVAQEVLETVRKGQKVSLRKIAVKHGYTQSVADKPQKITGTQSYQDVVATSSRPHRSADSLLKHSDRTQARCSECETVENKRL